MNPQSPSVTVAAPSGVASPVDLSDCLMKLLVEQCGQSAVDRRSPNRPIKSLVCGLWLHLTQNGADQSPILDFYNKDEIKREDHILRVELVGTTEARISENARGRSAQMRRDDFTYLHGQAYQIVAAFFYRTLP